MAPKNTEKDKAKTNKTQSAPTSQRRSESSNSQGGKGKNKAQEKPEPDTSELTKQSPARDSGKPRRIGFAAPYVPRQKLEQQPGEKTGYLSQMERELEGRTRLTDKDYGDIKPGDFIMGPCYGLTIFSERIGTSKITQQFNSKHEFDAGKEFNNADNKHHPLIVIGKNKDGSLQAVICTTLGVEGGGKLEDRRAPSLDATACKYHVPMEGRPHEDNYEAKGQPGFTIKFTKGPYISLGGEKSSGWACSFMYFIIFPTAKNKTFRVAEEVSITSESLKDLQAEIDKNELERIKFIDANRGLFDDPKNGYFSNHKINMLKSRKGPIGASKATPPSGPQEKAGPPVNARSGRDAGSSSHGASSKTSRGSGPKRGTDSTGGRGRGGSHDRDTGDTSTGGLGKRGLEGSRWAQ